MKMVPALFLTAYRALAAGAAPSIGLNFPMWATKLSVVLNQWGGEW